MELEWIAEKGRGGIGEGRMEGEGNVAIGRIAWIRMMDLEWAKHGQREWCKSHTHVAACNGQVRGEEEEHRRDNHVGNAEQIADPAQRTG